MMTKLTTMKVMQVVMTVVMMFCQGGMRMKLQRRWYGRARAKLTTIQSIVRKFITRRRYLRDRVRPSS
jgi:hypothetical protein